MHNEKQLFLIREWRVDLWGRLLKKCAQLVPPGQCGNPTLLYSIVVSKTYCQKKMFYCQIRCFSSNLKIFKKKYFQPNSMFFLQMLKFQKHFFCQKWMFYCQIRCFFVKFEDFQKKNFFAEFDVFSSNFNFFKKNIFCQKQMFYCQIRCFFVKF